MSAYPTTRPAFERRVDFHKVRSPFSGLLTNKLLSSLPGAEFAELLPYLEPVSFRTGEFICEQGQEMPYVYFPETVVISQLFYLGDGSSTGVAIIGKDGLLGLSYWFDSASKLTLGYRADYFKGSSAFNIGTTAADSANRVDHGPMVRFSIQK